MPMAPDLICLFLVSESGSSLNRKKLIQAWGIEESGNVINERYYAMISKVAKSTVRNHTKLL